MLRLEKKENNYDVYFHSTNKYLGQFIQDVDGFYYYYTNNTSGLWSQLLLSLLSESLESLNKGWSNEIDQYFKDHPNDPNFNDLDFTFDN